MTDLKLTLPYPVSVNHYKRVGRTVRTKSGKIYQQRVNTPETTAFYYQVQMRVGHVIIREPPIFARDSTIKVGVSLSIYPPDNRRRDIDNCLKVIFDSLMKAKVIKDDSQICRLFVQKCEPIEHGSVEIVIYTL